MSVLVLVVDDEPDVEALFRQQFRRDLKTQRFVMDFAVSAADALTRIAGPLPRWFTTSRFWQLNGRSQARWRVCGQKYLAIRRVGSGTSSFLCLTVGKFLEQPS